MRITLFAAGSQGDVLFCMRLVKRLRTSGFSVTLAAPENYASLAQNSGIRFFPLHGDVQQLMASDTGKEFMHTGSNNPLKNIALMRRMVAQVAQQLSEDLLAACAEAEALISLAVFASLGETVAELCNIPLLLIEPTPMLPSGDFPAPGWPIQRNLGRVFNRLSGYAMLAFVFAWYRPSLNAFRAQNGLHRLNSRDFYRTLASVPMLGAYSSALIPHPDDWPDSARITGYWLDEEEPSLQPSETLGAFLERGESPVYIGFGSMTAKDPERMAQIVHDAVLRTGRRAVIATGWGGISTLSSSDQVFVLDQAPHDWLFPRMSVIVHHGGAGTTAEALRAGKPNVIVPFIVDQQFWGRRVQALGAGPAPIPARKLTAKRLADAIERAATDPAMRENAERIRSSILAEHGLEQAAAFIQEYWGTSI